MNILDRVSKILPCLTRLFGQKSSDAGVLHVVSISDLEPDDYAYIIGKLFQAKERPEFNTGGKFNAQAFKEGFSWDIVVTEWGCTPAKAKKLQTDLVNRLSEQDRELGRVLEDMITEGNIRILPGSTTSPATKAEPQRLALAAIAKRDANTHKDASDSEIQVTRSAVAQRLLKKAASNATVEFDIISPLNDALYILGEYERNGGALKKLDGRFYGSFNWDESVKLIKGPIHGKTLQEWGDHLGAAGFSLYNRRTVCGKDYSTGITTSKGHLAQILFAQTLRDSQSPLVQGMIETAKIWNKSIFYYKARGAVEKALEASGVELSSAPAMLAFNIAFPHEQYDMSRSGADFELGDTAQKFDIFFTQHFDLNIIQQQANAEDAAVKAEKIASAREGRAQSDIPTPAKKALERLGQIETMAKDESQMAMADILLLVSPEGFAAAEEEFDRSGFRKVGPIDGERGLKRLLAAMSVILPIDERANFIQKLDEIIAPEIKDQVEPS